MSGLLLEMVQSDCACWPCLLLILVHAHTSVLCPCWSVAKYTLYRVFLCTVISPILSMLIGCGLLSHRIVDIVWICYLFPFAILLLRDILFVMPKIVLLLFQYLFSGLPSTARGTCRLTNNMLLIYWPCITLFFHFFFKDSPSLAWFVAFLPVLCHCSHLTDLFLLRPLLLFSSPNS